MCLMYWQEYQMTIEDGVNSVAFQKNSGWQNFER